MCKLVMIDDNPLEHLIMQKMFDHYELFHNASHSLDGRAIIDFLKGNRANTEELPDIIFLDLHMPDFSGWDFLEQFKRLCRSFPKPISIYIVSSSIDPRDRLRSLQYPFVKEFLTKPLHKNKLELLYTTYLNINRRAG
jgi:CheY-like chemotaxis protein